MHNVLAKVNNNGVTLIEMMIVLALLSIVAAIAVPLYTDYASAAMLGECKNEVAAIRLAEEEFFLTNNNTYISGALDSTSATNTLEPALGGLYQASGKALDPLKTNCSYIVAAGPCGSIANCYTITATGQNLLATEGIVVVINGP